jgi:hypothetical protein
MPHAGRLALEYAVDSGARLVQNRLNYIRTHQTELRAEAYGVLADALAGDGDANANNVGQRVVLPSSHVGSPRFMNQLYQDAMATVAKLGSIDLFITITANPNWPEITQSLLPGQTPAERPDIVNRVFRLKVDSIMDDILKSRVFGRAVAHIYVIEFQKRGLPHCHLLIILDDADKIRSVEDIDSVVCAEIPDPETHPKLFATITTCNMHGPCGEAAPGSQPPCWKDGACSKRFPKEFCAETVLSENGYPQYRRRNDGRVVRVRGADLDNRWVVPYNPYLSQKYDCHINVEICTTVSAVKYLYKYVYKGGDRAAVYLVTENGDRYNRVDFYISLYDAISDLINV